MSRDPRERDPREFINLPLYIYYLFNIGLTEIYLFYKTVSIQFINDDNQKIFYACTYDTIYMYKIYMYIRKLEAGYKRN